MNALLGTAGFLAFLVFGIAQLATGFVGIEHGLGSFVVWGGSSLLRSCFSFCPAHHHRLVLWYHECFGVAPGISYSVCSTGATFSYPRSSGFRLRTGQTVT